MDLPAAMELPSVVWLRAALDKLMAAHITDPIEAANRARAASALAGMMVARLIESDQPTDVVCTWQGNTFAEPGPEAGTLVRCCVCRPVVSVGGRQVLATSVWKLWIDVNAPDHEETVFNRYAASVAALLDYLVMPRREAAPVLLLPAPEWARQVTRVLVGRICHHYRVRNPLLT